MNKEKFFINNKKVKELEFWNFFDQNKDKRRKYTNNYLFDYLVKSQSNLAKGVAVFKVKNTFLRVEEQ
jgi:hypothetical protein